MSLMDEYFVVHNSGYYEDILKSGSLKNPKQLGTELETWFTEFIEMDYEKITGENTYKMETSELLNRYFQIPENQRYFTQKDFDNYNSSIFTSLVSYKTSKINTFQSRSYYSIYFIFSPKLVKYASHLCKYYIFGKFIENKCSYYDKSKSIENNIQEFKKYSTNVVNNELVFKDFEISLKDYLVAIYVPNNMKNMPEILKLSKEYSQYKWIFQNF